jgi:NAD(P)-dependent dehydrogenase (short-subunit alcohol dehydrogenase family)
MACHSNRGILIMTPNRYQDRVAIVTGGSMGIGRATALQLATEGAHVVACARRLPRLEELAAEIAALGGSFTPVALDVSDVEAFAKLVADTAQKHGRLDLLVNNAPQVVGGTVLEQSIEDWRANFGVSVESVFIGVQAAMRVMVPQGSGAIVNISSVSSLRAGEAAGAYSAAKAAVNQFSLCAAMESGPHNVRVNVVAAGAVETPGLNASVHKNEAMKKLMGDAIPMKRIGTAEEMAEAICFIGSDDAAFINGVILPVDGGKTPQLHVPDWELTLDNR